MAPTPNQAMLAAGFTEVALGALTGWPYALAIAEPERAKALGIRSNHRMRQWHLDLISLGGLTVLAAAAVPGLPKSVAVPLTVGAWTNANAFGVLVVRPDLHDNPVYRAGVLASFVTTSVGFVGLARAAWRAAR